MWPTQPVVGQLPYEREESPVNVIAVVLTVIALATTVAGIVLFVRAIRSIVAVSRMGQPAPDRYDHPGRRWKNLLVESIGHTRMLQWSKVGVAHWFVMVGFGFLFLTLVNAFGQLIDPRFTLPLIGHLLPYEWATELLAWVGGLSIAGLMVLRSVVGTTPGSRFFGSRTWQARYVEWTILLVMVCILGLRALEFQLFGDRLHFPLTSWLLPTVSAETAEVWIRCLAATKIIISFAWMCVISLNPTMGVAWHRFTAWVNIWFKRESSGAQALGAVPPILVDGAPLDFNELEDLDEDTALGVATIEDFTWKGLLDFTSCTECGRCQSQCPAWNTEKPLSPKLLVMGLREHAHAASPWLQAAEAVEAERARPLIGDTGEDKRAAAVAQAHGSPIQWGSDGAVAVIDPDVLWSCTSCGACVQQCPVDIEHVDHIINLRRHQVLMESDFPSELNGLFKGLESKGNPWNMNARKRMEWAKPLDFEVPIVGDDVEDLTEVEYLFWVGCAGAYEDRAIKTTQAVATLLHTAGVSFAVLGNGETCTGDPARRAGNEFVFQQLAMENVEALTEAKANKVVTTCAHCLNTLKNEYPQLGTSLEVVHHTQLLNRLVREGKLTPVAPVESSVAGRTITYHDPCFLGRHNQVYEAPRELLGAIPGATVAEMPRHGKQSFCCGAGGARMWMEETIGTRINASRTDEALTVIESNGGSGAIATACPFCRVMLSDGLTAAQGEGRGEQAEVLDVAQLLLAGVERGVSQQP